MTAFPEHDRGRTVDNRKRSTFMFMRSKLFVPGNRPELFAKAFSSAADAVCFDLEDAVPASKKAEARAHVGEFLGRNPKTAQVVMVRVNNFHSPDFAEDMSAIVCRAVAVLALPKSETTSEVTEAAEALQSLEKQRGVERPIAILPTIESSRGLQFAGAIAAADLRVIGIQLGLADLLQSLGIQHNDPYAAHHVRLQLRLQVASSGLPCFDSAFNSVADLDGFKQDSRVARSLGFSGKSCIHPTQVAPANQIFSPTVEEISWSRRIVEAARDASVSGNGAFLLDGQMIDEPFIKQAKRILEIANDLERKVAEREGRE
jgi:citrate lyase subunit beta/citryl-CoA lyase